MQLSLVAYKPEARKLNTQKRIISLATLLLVASWVNSAVLSTVSVTGIAVDSLGSTNHVGIQDSNGEITYFIPLNDADTGVYGTGSTSCGSEIGTCSDTGYGTGYNPASALEMNIHFDLSSLVSTENSV